MRIPTVPPPSGGNQRQECFSRHDHQDFSARSLLQNNLDCGFPLVTYVTGHSLENLSLREGQVVSASFKATAIHVIRKTSRATIPSLPAHEN
jgi:molybdopterin-binding protein